MAEIREERVTTERVESDPVVADRGVVADPVRRGNPAPVIAAICIALLVLFLVFFGMSRNNSGDGNNDPVRITVPNGDNDDGTSSGDSGTSDKSGSGTSGNTSGSTSGSSDSGTTATTTKP
ncbi:MAG TPA: hypothetical protein VM143_11835 [Acidimicrobiales bacterium]|nr:hypothetical protein [Acidimicrobiales bacterium]